MMYAVIDIGSNTIRLVIYSMENISPCPMLNKKYSAGLAGYVNENNELYYECRILIKPLMEMNGKDLQVQLKPNEAQQRYYSADQSQRMFQTMHYPIKKTADQYDCIEFMYRLGSHGFLEMQQAQWEEAMNEISLELSYGAVKETITFACEPVTTYSKNEENISAVLYYGVIREE